MGLSNLLLSELLRSRAQLSDFLEHKGVLEQVVVVFHVPNVQHVRVVDFGDLVDQLHFELIVRLGVDCILHLAVFRILGHGGNIVVVEWQRQLESMCWLMQF